VGFHQTAIAAKGLAPEALWQQLGFDGPATPESEGVHDGVFSLASGEWTTVVADGAEHFLLLTPELACGLEAAVVVFFVNHEASMHTELAVLADGELVWRVQVHWEGTQDVALQGNVPAELREQLLELDEEATYGFPQALLEHTAGVDLREQREVVRLSSA